MTEDFYDLLEIPPDASQDEIKDAYREQVRVYHPDLNDDDRAQAQFTAVKTAYDILGDPVERQAYDRLGHKDYVAKRTSGLPSPDVWKSNDGDDEETDGTELNYSESETKSAAEATAGSGTAGSSASASNRSSTATAGATGSTTTGTASASTTGTAQRTASATGTGTGTAGGSDTGTAGRTTSAAGETTRGTGDPSERDTQTGARSETAGNPIIRWWRRQNLSLPLLWLSLFVYVGGLGHFALANESTLATLWADVRALGTDPAGIWSLLSASRHGLETSVAFVRGVEVVASPLEPTLWYAALAGVVALAVAALLVTRIVGRENPWGAVTIDETVVVALAVGVATTLVGGPLLAGAVLMPLLFGVIVRHTRRLPGWTPSYLYVVPVLAPATGFVAATVDAASLPVDLAAFVFVPLFGGLVLPVRATIRKHFRR